MQLIKSCFGKGRGICCAKSNHKFKYGNLQGKVSPTMTHIHKLHNPVFEILRIYNLQTTKEMKDVIPTWKGLGRTGELKLTLQQSQ